MANATIGPLAHLAAQRRPAQAVHSTAGTATYDANAFRDANDADLHALGIHVAGKGSHKDAGYVEELTACPFSQDHDDGAYRAQKNSRYIDVRCHHERCTGKSLKSEADLFPQSNAIRPLGSSAARLTNNGARTTPNGLESPTFELIAPKPAAMDAKPAMHRAAYYGVAGDAVRAIKPTTEADPAAVLVTLLTMFGNACGRGPHVLVGDSRHGANLFAVLVGETSRARKGTAQDGPRRLMQLADPEWATLRVQGGLSSGEGLIWAVRDDVQKYNAKSGEWTIEVPGVTDKRLLCIEEEFSQILKTGQRQGATISEITRRAWDSRSLLQTMTKTSPAVATDAHVSILGHITKMELAQQITETDLANGMANRFAWFRVRREQLLPNPVALSDAAAYALSDRIRDALTFAKDTGIVTRDAAASEVWTYAYAQLERERPGLAGATTARSSPITLRLSLIYALLDCSRVIRPEHLEAALAVWDYAESSVTSIFGDLTGDTVADRILALLQTDPRMSRTDITDALGRNIPSARIGVALDTLHNAGRLQAWKERGKGRPTTVYELVADDAA